MRYMLSMTLRLVVHNYIIQANAGEGDGMQQMYQCSSCGTPIAYGTRFCGNCGVQLTWTTQQPTHAEMLSSRLEQRYSRNLVSLHSGDIPLKSRQEKTLWCIDSSGEIVVLITPRAAWEKVGFETTMYSQQYSISMVLVCLGVNTENPALMPAVIPLQKGFELKQIAEMVGMYAEIPSQSRMAIPSIFSAIQFLQLGNNASIGIALRRVGKNLERGELSTVLPDGREISIFHTCLANGKPSPYSLKEIYTLKVKGWLNID